VGDLWALLGYDAVAARVAEAMNEGDDACLIEGPPGVGKSWLAKGIGSLWEQSGGATVVVEGDPLRTDVSLYPFSFAMVGLAKGWGNVVPAIANVAKASEVLLGTAGLITNTVELLDSVRRRRRSPRAVLLDDQEQQILHELGSLARKRPLLLIADNLHWWDEASLVLLAQLRAPRMVEAFSFLTELRVLAVETPAPYQTVAHPETHATVLRAGSTRRFPIAKIPEDRFPEVLAALGAGESPDREVSDVLYALSGGHLALASRCAQRLASNDAAAFLAAADTDGFISRLLTERLESLGPDGRTAVQLLEVGAALGLRFGTREVVCASEFEASETRRLLRACRDERLLDSSHDNHVFVHELYRRHLLDQASGDRVEIHERLADCLRRIRPGDYELRCANAIAAERPEVAGALAVHTGLLRERDGGSWRDAPATITSAIETAGFVDVMERLAGALAHAARYECHEGVGLLDGLRSDLPSSLMAEAEYLRAMCLMSTRGEDDRAAGRSILDSWLGFETQEPELGTRMCLLRILGYARTMNKAPGRALEVELKRFLVDRAPYDSSATDALYMLDRSSASLYETDVALIRTKKAVDFHRPSSDNDVPRRPVEYYRCLNNYCAELVSNAEYELAVMAHRELEAFIATYAPGTFPRLDFPAMNGLLAGFRSGLVSVDDAIRRQERIVDELAPAPDRFYAENGLAVYLALAGRYERSIAVLAQIDETLRQTRAMPDPSMVYMIRANRCVARFLAGDTEGLADEWADLTPVVNSITYMLQPYLVRRHELLHSFLRRDAVTSTEEFDRCVVRAYPEEFGKLWDNYGRALRIAVVQFWKEN
jgi:hypothetical protein